MKPYDHSEFEHERRAFAELEAYLPVSSDHFELYPSLYITDPGRKVKHECDLLFISESFAAVIELKDWQGDIGIAAGLWQRFGSVRRDPHEINLPKAKVFKSLIEKSLPAARVPFVQSIVVLTSSNATVSGEDSAYEVIREYEEKGRLGDHLTFLGMMELGKYLKERVKRAREKGRNQLSPQEFSRLRKEWDMYFEVGRSREDYADQVSGFRIQKELEHAERYVSYLAEANPPHGDALYRLRVFGTAAASPEEQARQFRSLDALERLSPHPHIRRVHRHANEKNLVVEVCQWGDVRTLEDELEANESIGTQYSARLIRDVARALAHVHESDAGLIHRNVTPRSVIVGRDAHVELTNFDLAYDPEATHTVMIESFSSYEKHYYAPEALAGGPDFTSDVYSLGKILLDLLKKSESESEELLQLAGKMADQNRKGRPSAREVVCQLAAWLGEEPDADEVLGGMENPREPEVGDTHDTWKLKEELGAGGTSKVFLGDAHGDIAALKIFRGEVPRERCLTERDFLRKAHSPFIAGYRSFVQWNRVYWCIVQEYAEGASLKTLISEGERPAVGTFLSVADQMLQALGELHSPEGESNGNSQTAQIIHNDVTPANIVFNKERQQAKLIDFGLASVGGGKISGGTRGYAAKDLMTKEGYLASPSGDVYALAITLVEWGTGTRPACREDIGPLFCQDLGSIESERLSEVFRRALSPAGERFSSAKEFQQALIGLRVTSGNDDNASEQFRNGSLGSTEYAQTQEFVAGSAETDYQEDNSSYGADSFVRYLNSIHNISADNRHALAEAQAISPYFTDLHVEMDLTDSIEDLFKESGDVVVVLTGHAGDGKSTIALDLWRRALKVPPSEPLPRAPKEEEVVDFYDSTLTVIKDMSELASRTRALKLESALEGSGSALIVSNTGPLLSAFTKLFAQTDSDKRDCQKKVLECLNKPLVDDKLSEVNCFQFKSDKKVYIANLSMLSNVQVAEKLLGRLITHPAWEGCEHCSAVSRCPIKRNVEVLRECSGYVRERVGNIYSRLDAYGRRMTMRQISAHLSFSLSGGVSCDEIRGDALVQHLFSETFFGHAGKLSTQAEDSLSCLRQMSDLHFGVATAPRFDYQIQDGKIEEDWIYPGGLGDSKNRLLHEVVGLSESSARQSLRRLTYMFGRSQTGKESAANVFFDDFLQSPMLRTLRDWTNNNGLFGVQKKKFQKKVFRVLMEEYVGSSVRNNTREDLFITMRRPDERVFQPIQIILKQVPFEDFEVVFESSSSLPKLKHHNSHASLTLSLPLLDYIVSRDQGELTSGLDAIHRASLEQFRSDLLEKSGREADTIKLLEIDAQGELRTHKFRPSDDGQQLDYE